MRWIACLGVMLWCVTVGCEGDSADGSCEPGTPSCLEGDDDGDGVSNTYDDFPSDPACAEEDDENCGACGMACAASSTCAAGVCVCHPAFTGDNCDQCADPLRAGLDCDECADPAFTGDACDQCSSPALTGPGCDQCVDPRFTGDACDQCADPTKTGPDCETCKDPMMSGPDCDVPVEPDPTDDLRNCLDFRACVITACGDAPAEEMAICAAEAMAACGEPVSDEESATATSVVDCMVEACDSLGETPSNYECWRQKCMPEHVACAASSFGELKCEFLGACMKDCGAQVSDTDWGCVRACYETGSELAVERYIDLDFCIRAQCYGASDWHLCKQEVRLNTPLCHIPMVACVMDP